MDAHPLPNPIPAPSPLPQAAPLLAVLSVLALSPACGHSPTAAVPARPPAAKPAAPPAAPAPDDRLQQPDVELRTPASFDLSPAEAAAMAGPGPEPPAPGSVDKEVVRRVIKSHAPDLKKACYEPELAKNAALAGVMSVDVTIGAAGRVLTSSLRDSTMRNNAVETCTVEAVRRWLFPRLIGNRVLIVTCHFKMAPVT
jgi:hypothetical protein